MMSESAGASLTLAGFVQSGALFLAGSFFIYGLSCLFTTRMQREFVRYGLPHLRILTGLSQTLAALLLVLATLKHWTILSLILFLFLFMMMVVALWVRLRIQDSWRQTLPALIYLLFSLALLSGALFEMLTA